MTEMSSEIPRTIKPSGFCRQHNSAVECYLCRDAPQEFGPVGPPHPPDPQVGDEVVLRGIVTQRAIDTLGRDIVQVTAGPESYWFARADQAEPVPTDAASLPMVDDPSDDCGQDPCTCPPDDAKEMS